MIFGNPVRGTIRPPGSPSQRGSFRVTQPWGPTSLTGEPRVRWPGGEGVSAGTYAHFHQGLDLGDALCGSDVLAAQAGKVIYSAKSSSGSETIQIDHGQGLITWYAHLRTRKVAKGATVEKGQLIGTVGDTGNAIGCHLNFALEDRNFGGTVVAFRGVVPSLIKFVDPWPRLEQNAEDEVITVTDTVPKNVTLAAGAVEYDPSTGAKLGTTNSPLVRYSPYGVTIGGTAARVLPIGNPFVLTAFKVNDPKVNVADIPAPVVPTKLASGTYQVE